MEQQKPISHIAAGLMIAGVMVVYSLILNFLGQSQNQSLGWIAYLLLIVALVFFIRQYGKNYGYSKSFGELFGYGFKITSIVTLIVILFLVIFFSAMPEYKEKIIEASRTAMEEQGKMSDDQIDSALEMFDRNFFLLTAGGALFMYLVIGLIGSLIGAAVTKKRPNNPFDQQSV